MKNWLIVLSLIFCISYGVNAQECNAALFMKKGSVLEYTNFNKKGKAESKVVHETLDLNENDGRFEALIKATIITEKDKNSFSSEYKAICENGMFSLDMIRFFDMTALQQYEGSDFDIEIDGDVLHFPVEMKPGDTMNDGSITIKVSKEGFTLVTMTLDIINRTVHDNETVTTAAGTFDCQKVTYDFNSKVGFIKVRGSGTEWYDKDKAIVRSESYNKKGKKIASMELASKK